MDVRLLTEQDADDFVRLRLEALTTTPQAFGRAPEESLPWPPDTVASRMRAVPEGNFLVGAFDGPRMVGEAGFFRHEGIKIRHKGTIWGVYVTDAARGRGAARAMLNLILERLRSYPDLEQVLLSVATSQDAARALYGSLGFEVFGCERRALKIGETYADEEHRVLWLRKSP